MIQPHFQGVTYIGSKLKATGMQSNGIMPAYRLTQHEFLLTDEDLTKYKHYTNERNAMVLSEVKEWSPVATERPELTTVYAQVRMGIDENDNTMYSRMVLSPAEATSINALIDKAIEPRKEKVAGGPVITIGTEQPKPQYHVDFPDNTLEYLPGVKSALKEGLITNLMKQWFSVVAYSQRITDLNAAITEWATKVKESVSK